MRFREVLQNEGNTVQQSKSYSTWMNDNISNDSLETNQECLGWDQNQIRNWG